MHFYDTNAKHSREHLMSSISIIYQQAFPKEYIQISGGSIYRIFDDPVVHRSVVFVFVFVFYSFQPLRVTFVSLVLKYFAMFQEKTSLYVVHLYCNAQIYLHIKTNH